MRMLLHCSSMRHSRKQFLCIRVLIVRHHVVDNRKKLSQAHPPATVCQTCTRPTLDVLLTLTTAIKFPLHSAHIPQRTDCVSGSHCSTTSTLGCDSNCHCSANGTRLHTHTTGHFDNDFTWGPDASLRCSLLKRLTRSLMFQE